MRINEELMLRAWCDYRGQEYAEGCDIPSENFKRGFKAVYDLPLADRLTVEEREIIIRRYMECHGKRTEYYQGACEGFRCIFGHEIFNNLLRKNGNN